MEPRLERYQTPRGARIYRMPLQLFHEFWGYAYLVCWGETCALVDTGSGFGDSNEHLEANLEQVASQYSEKVSWDSLTDVLITHGHIDHFGGLPFVRQRTQAPIGVHGLDLRVLASYEDRLDNVAARLRWFLHETGTSPDQVESMMDMYMLTKGLFTSVEVNFTFESLGMRVGPLQVIHVPGHCPGQVVILVDDVLLSSDHVLENTSPHQAPERLSLHTGLAHYLESLDKLEPLAGKVRLTLGGHEGPVEALGERMEAIRTMHFQRLESVLEMTERPTTVAAISKALFPEPKGYHALLALEEAGAHVEYLLQRGYLEVENHAELSVARPVPILYRRRRGYAPALRVSEEARSWR